MSFTEYFNLPLPIIEIVDKVQDEIMRDKLKAIEKVNKQKPTKISTNKRS